MLDTALVINSSHEYTILDNNTGYSLASSADGLLNALCEGQFSIIILQISLYN